MHAHAFDFVAQALQYLEPNPSAVLEIGARNVNGSIRPLFRAATYVGVDVAPGPDVDVVADGARVTLADCGMPSHVAVPVEGADEPALARGGFDVAVCCEVLEHAANWPEIVANMARLVRAGGGLIVTCAGPGRAPHSAVDGGALRDGEYYRNVAGVELEGAARAAGVRALHCVERTDRGDVYLVGLVES